MQHIDTLLANLSAAEGRHAQALSGHMDAIAEYRGEVAHFGDAGPGTALRLQAGPALSTEDADIEAAEDALELAGYIFTTPEQSAAFAEREALTWNAANPSPF